MAQIVGMKDDAVSANDIVKARSKTSLSIYDIFNDDDDDEDDALSNKRRLSKWTPGSFNLGDLD